MAGISKEERERRERWLEAASERRREESRRLLGDKLLAGFSYEELAVIGSALEAARLLMAGDRRETATALRSLVNRELTERDFQRERAQEEAGGVWPLPATEEEQSTNG